MFRANTARDGGVPPAGAPGTVFALADSCFVGHFTALMKTFLLFLLLGGAAGNALAANGTLSMDDAAWRAYNQGRQSKVVLRGQLVDRSALTMVTGFIARVRAKVRDDSRNYTGAVLNLAVRKPDTTAVQGMDLRPSLWQRSDEQVLLLDYDPEREPGALVRVYGMELRRINGLRAFSVATEPTFEQWKRLALNQ